MDILTVKGLEASYGMSQILFGVDLTVEQGESVCLLGRNGVGKTTTIRSIMGSLKPGKGSVIFDGQEICGMPSHAICKRGMSYVPQGRRIFSSLTTKENLLVSEKKGPDGSNVWTLDKVYELFPRLKERENSMGTQLSGGEQQMLTIARGLIQNPKLLLLDEITEGLAPVVVNELVEVIGKLREQGVSILVAEQSVKFALQVSSRCYILEKGKVVYSGRSDEIPDEIFREYLGT